MVTATKMAPNEIEELNKVIAVTDRVKKRKEEYVRATPHICAERSRLATESWKQTEGEHFHIRRAKLFKRVMEGISIAIREGELIVGSQTKYIRGAGPHADWRSSITFELFKDGEITLKGVKRAEVSEAEKVSLLDDAHFWKGKSPADAIFDLWRQVLGNKMGDLQEARVTLGIGQRPVVSRTADYGKVIDQGLDSIIAEAKKRLQRLSSFSAQDDVSRYHFLQAVIIACEAVIDFAHRYAELARELASKEHDLGRRKELEKIADTCQRVPASPARSFYEALQSFWFTHLSINLEASYALEAPGRMDQYLYSLYQKDLEEGRLTRQQAAELLGCLWVKFAEIEVVHGTVWGQATQESQFQDITIGGVTGDGTDATNELTYLILEVTRQLKTAQPAIYLRCHKGTPEELWMKAVEVYRNRGDGQPAFLNDEAQLLNFVGLGIPIREARNWVGSGCAEPFVAGVSTGDRPLNFGLAQIFQLTLNNGIDPRTGKQLGPATGDPRNFSSYDELYTAFKKQVEYFVELIGKVHRLLWQERAGRYSLPFFSALMGDCIDKGLDYMAGGCRYPQLYYGFHDRGHQNVADSLAAIKKLVFEERKIGMAELLEALAVNFEGKEKLRQMLLAAPKYGNDDDYVDGIFNDLSLWSQRRMAQERHPLGVNQRVIRGGATKHYYYGKTLGALPDGRKAGEPLADGSLSPMRGVDLKGPTAVINSATKINHLEIVTNTLFNMKVSPGILETREGVRNFIALIKTYFNRGGYHIQFNTMGQEMLLEAKKHPEKYRELLVRVAGYSAYFVDLSPEVQDEIIARTEHTL